MSFLKKKIMIVSFSVCILIFLMILAIIFFNNPPSKDLIEAVDTAWASAKTEEQPTYLIKLDELSSYELNSVTHEDDRYIIKATVTAPDLGAQLSQLDYAELPQTDSTEDINAFLCEQIEKSEIKKTETFIYAYKINEEYYISFSDGFADAMSGNLYKYSLTAFVEMIQKYKEGKIK